MIWGSRQGRELQAKLDGLSEIAGRKGIPGIWIKLSKNISWLIGGRPYISMYGSEGVASLVFKDGSLHLVTDDVENKRLINEEFTRGGFEVVTLPWYEKAKEKQLVESMFGKSLAEDTSLEEEIRPLRMTLNQSEIETIRSLGIKAGEVVQEACRSCKIGMSEKQIAGIVSGIAASVGIEPHLILVGADERISSYRHPMPTDKKLNSLAMIAFVGKSCGLHAALTRFVSFGKPYEKLLAKQAVLNRISARLAARTRPGTDFTDIFRGLMEDYDKEGFSGEWKNHHQGGPIGYQARELKATPEMRFSVMEDQAYAWNPSVEGFKIEDTFIVRKFANERITPTPLIPKLEVAEGGVEWAASDILYL